MFQLVRSGRVNGPVIKQKNADKNKELEYLTFDLLEQTGLVKQFFSTRTGGVSKGIYSSMNLRFTGEDDPEAVLENYRRVAQVLGCNVGDMVASQQTHTTNIRQVTAADKGKGVICERDYNDIDGFITNEKGIALTTFYADCVPLYFVDTEHEAIGLAHSGWRGTAMQMGACMVKAMREAFGTVPEKLVAAIGPSICQEYYEVSEEVALVFQKLFASEEADRIQREIAASDCYSHGDGKIRTVVEPGKAPGKYQLDLWLANLIILRMAGIPLERIAVTDVCTCHNAEYLFSHRATQGKRGNLAAFLMLKTTDN